MKTKFVTACLLLCSTLSAQNPIVPPGVFLADPEGHQWKDGRLYLYVSRDESPDYYCSYQYDLISTSDMKNWTITENAFASKGPNDQVPYSDGALYASDAAYKDGKYYLYYSMNDRIDEGVAVSDAPDGPFRNGQPMKGISQIDPAVFIDDDGQAYLYWGQFSAKGAKLKDNMLEVDTTTIVDGLVTEQEHFFHEGSSMRKRNGIYYLVYAHLRKGRPTCIGYATSKSPLGPFKYGGVIVDNAGCDPESWNNHGSICEFNGNWYVLYHRTTNGTRSLRKVCIEPITFNEDGSINEVEMTSQGAGDPLCAFDNIPAERACLLWGNTRIHLKSQHDEELSGIRNDNYAVYKYIDFGEGADTFTVNVTPQSGGKIEVWIDNLWTPPVGVIDVPADRKGETLTLTGKISPVKGVHALTLRFMGDKESEELFTVDSFRFGKQ
ncbi:MAG TPA: family 43 glycosylhydrolase [Candidatus Alistipes merdigallinarum]|nr:family 43 glycosylhydrolase [Candidatus Alistipes merdigallinarum]